MEHSLSPDENRNPAELSLEELKSKIYDSLKQNGTVNSLRAQLRAQVLQGLRPKAQKAAPGDRSISPVLPNTRLSYFMKVVNSLVLDYLQKQGYLCSFSVFLPESGMHGLEMPISDIVEVISITLLPQLIWL